jgi:hypothetical protein
MNALFPAMRANVFVGHFTACDAAILENCASGYGQHRPASAAIALNHSIGARAAFKPLYQGLLGVWNGWRDKMHARILQTRQSK